MLHDTGILSESSILLNKTDIQKNLSGIIHKCIKGMGKRELVALLHLSSMCLMIVEWLFLTVPRGCLQFVIVVFSDHTHLLFLIGSLVTLLMKN